MTKTIITQPYYKYYDLCESQCKTQALCFGALKILRWKGRVMKTHPDVPRCVLLIMDCFKSTFLKVKLFGLFDKHSCNWRKSTLNKGQPEHDTHAQTTQAVCTQLTVIGVFFTSVGATGQFLPNMWPAVTEKQFIKSSTCVSKYVIIIISYIWPNDLKVTDQENLHKDKQLFMKVLWWGLVYIHFILNVPLWASLQSLH